MDISKFDFTKFTLSKWERVLNIIGSENDEAIKLDVDYPIIDGEIVPQANVTYVYESEVDGEEEYVITYSAFEVKIKTDILPDATKKWRRFMVKEFGEVYRYRLVNYLEAIKEEKIRQADVEFNSAVLDLHNI